MAFYANKCWHTIFLNAKYLLLLCSDEGSEFEARNYIQPSPYIAVPHHDQSGNQVQYQQHHVEPYVNNGTAPSYSYTNSTLQPLQQTSWVNYANSNSNAISNTANPQTTQQSAANMNQVQFSTTQQC